MFTGFKIDYPEYTVVTPQTGLSYGVRYLTVAEVNKLKSSLSVPSKVTSIINKVIWDSLVSKPSGIKKYEDFMKHTTTKDREALLYGLYITTFGEERELEPSCTGCDASNKIKFNMSDCFSITPYPGSNAMIKSYGFGKASGMDADPEMEDIININKIKNLENDMSPIPREALASMVKPESGGIKLESDVEKSEEEAKNKEISLKEKQKEEEDAASKELRNITGILNKFIEVDLPISKVKAYIKQPTLWDEQKLLEEIPFSQRRQTDLASEILIVDRFEIYSNASSKPAQILISREDVLSAYNQLPNADKKDLFKRFKDEFSQYGITLEQSWVCKNCETENSLSLDIVSQFFRMVLEP